jgi:hypothetical protein
LRNPKGPKGARWISDRLPAPALGVGYAVLALCLVFAPVSAKSYFYFQF